jgi:hypothetical protein
MRMIMSNSNNSTVWSTRDITLSQLGCRYPEGPVIQ